jgi:hypothetical protein
LDQDEVPQLEAHQCPSVGAFLKARASRSQHAGSPAMFDWWPGGRSKAPGCLRGKLAPAIAG